MEQHSQNKRHLGFIIKVMIRSSLEEQIWNPLEYQIELAMSKNDDNLNIKREIFISLSLRQSYDKT